MQPPSKSAVVFDFNRTLFDPTTYTLYPGVVPMLDELASRKRLLLYSRKAWDRTDLLKSLGIDIYFTAAHFVERKTPENLRALLSEAGAQPQETVVVGDMLADELCVGAELGITTVWLMHPMTHSETLAIEPPCVPDYTVRSIEELREKLASL